MSLRAEIAIEGFTRFGNFVGMQSIAEFRLDDFRLGCAHQQFRSRVGLPNEAIAIVDHDRIERTQKQRLDKVVARETRD
jgi:hypothetical protein